VDLPDRLKDIRWETLLALLPACAQRPSGSVTVVINAAPVPQKPEAAAGEGAPGKAAGGSKATLATRWTIRVEGLFRLCNVARWEDLPVIWHTLDPLAKSKSRAALETALTATANRLGYDTPFFTHNFTSLVLGLLFSA